MWNQRSKVQVPEFRVGRVVAGVLFSFFLKRVKKRLEYRQKKPAEKEKQKEMK